MNLISNTGIIFGNGSTTVSQALQTIDSTVNKLVDEVNKMLKGKVDINLEYNDFEKTYSVVEAAAAVMNIRRALGQKIRFKSVNGKYVEYSYVGDTLDNDSWLDDSNWEISLDVVDGGEF